MCDRGWHGHNCSLASCPRNCSGHGTCDVTTGVCACDVGWNLHSTCALQECASNCTNGVCVDGSCECNPGYEGDDCETFVCINSCSGHGNCNEEMQRCVCFPWWTGELCDTRLCPRDCSGHGYCDDGRCVCEPGYGGFDCATPLCPNDCSRRGSCLIDGTCSCETGWGGG